MSRIPATAPAGAAAPNYRLNMMRRAPAAAPAAAAARPRVVKAKASGQAVRKARPVRKASVKRDARKSAPAARRAARPAPAVLAPPARIPTPMPVAERELATPLSYALIETTVCEARGAAPAAVDAGIPGLAVAPGRDEPGFGGEGVFNPDGPGGPNGLFPPTFPPEGDNPIVILPPIGPPGVPPLTTPVPEPGTWALMIAGFGLLGARLRARRRASAG